MKKNCWYLYLFEGEDKTDIFKIMKFDTISEMSEVLQIKPAVLSNYFHGQSTKIMLESCSICRGYYPSQRRIYIS